MPIDTSSYYPEVNDPNNESGSSLNSSRTSLFNPKQNTQIASEANAIEEKVNVDPIKNENQDKNMGGSNSKSNKELPENNWQKIVTLFSNAISWILVPLLMPVYGTIFIFKLSVLDMVSPGMQTAFTFIIAGINFVVPVLLILLLKFLGVVNDVGLNGQKERAIPYVITAISLGVSAWFMAIKGAPIWVCMFYVGGAVAAIINLVINFRWKISAHAAAIAGVIALLIRLEKDMAVEPELFIWLLITIGAAGLLGSARIWMRRHTIWQVLAGYVVGFASVFFMMFIH